MKKEELEYLVGGVGALLIILAMMAAIVIG